LYTSSGLLVVSRVAVAASFVNANSAVALQPSDEGVAQHGGAGGHMIDLWLRLKDPLAQSIVQVGDLAAFVGVVDHCFAVAVLGVVFKDSEAVAGQVTCGIAGVVGGANPLGSVTMTMGTFGTTLWPINALARSHEIMGA
jgi:hypothetical protein